MLVGGETYTATAERLGIDRSTLWGRTHSSVFMEALESGLRALRDAAQARLVGMADKAIDALAAVMNGDNDSARVAAARTVLDRIGPAATGDRLPRADDPMAMTDDELQSRVRAAVLEEFRGLSDDAVVARVRRALDGDARCRPDTQGEME
jgi:arginine/ornithine N-succinyltransferase beta subunit